MVLFILHIIVNLREHPLHLFSLTYIQIRMRKYKFALFYSTYMYYNKNTYSNIEKILLSYFKKDYEVY